MMPQIDLNDFHFIRPDWFWALMPLLLLLWMLWRQRLASRSWRSVVDARLLPHLLIGEQGKGKPWALTVIALSGVIAITALAGPTWERLEQPVFRQQSALVVLLDMSRSMDAGDMRPSRLERARLKLHDILNIRREGQTALIAYAATPFVVSPLTSDGKTIASQLPSLSTDLMPAQGSRPDRALAKARELLQQGGVSHGAVLMITDGVEGVDQQRLSDEIKGLTDTGHRLLVLGVGTASGAPIQNPKGGFFQDTSGAIVIPKLDESALMSLAQQGGGLYRHLSADDKDIESLLAVVDAMFRDQKAEQAADLMSDQWQDRGVWLLLPLLLIAAFAFRRGYIAAILLTVFILPQSQPAEAMDWQSLWASDDQRAQQALNEGDATKAAELFKKNDWRAAAQYRAGDFEGSAQTLEGQKSADAYYNRGNALAKEGKFPEAISAYDEALKLQPKMEDAEFNRDLVEKLMQQQPKGEGGDSQQGDKGGQSQDQSQSQNQDQQNADQSQQGEGEENQQSQQGQESSDQQSQSQQGQQQSDQEMDAEQAKADDSGEKAEQSDDLSQQQQSKEEQNAAAEESDKMSAKAQREQLAEQSEMQQATEQWLRRIPDDPGGLWRRKFLYQYQRQQKGQGDEAQAW